MKLEIGKVYKDTSGDSIKIIDKIDSDKVYIGADVVDKTIQFYYKDGRTPSTFDLVIDMPKPYVLKEGAIYKRIDGSFTDEMAYFSDGLVQDTSSIYKRYVLDTEFTLDGEWPKYDPRQLDLSAGEFYKDTHIRLTEHTVIRDETGNVVKELE